MIDVKELRVGSHILVDGEIRVICEIDIDGITIEDDDAISGYIVLSKNTDFQPIPITEELLQEMGLEHLWEKDTWYWRKDFDDDQYVIVVIYDGYVRAKIRTKGDCPFNIFKCKYLHELETFMYLTLHEELIKE